MVAAALLDTPTGMRRCCGSCSPRSTPSVATCARYGTTLLPADTLTVVMRLAATSLACWPLSPSSRPEATRRTPAKGSTCRPCSSWHHDTPLARTAAWGLCCPPAEGCVSISSWRVASSDKSPWPSGPLAAPVPAVLPQLPLEVQGARGGACTDRGSDRALHGHRARVAAAGPGGRANPAGSEGCTGAPCAQPRHQAVRSPPASLPLHALEP